jgi:ABC-type transport system substrate-binding protein
LSDLLEERAAQIVSAQKVLYAVDDGGEPTLGTWIPAGKQGDAWVNEANPDVPFVQPNFDRAVYSVYQDEQSAVAALQNDQVDVILSSSGVASETQNAIENPTASARFLVFNPAGNLLSDVVLRRAIACLSPSTLPGFVLEGSFQNREPLFPCSGMTEDLKLKTAVDMLRTAGYSWTLEPSTGLAGSGLTLPDGSAFPRITLLSTLPEVDGQRAEAGRQIEQQALHLGIPIAVQLTDLASLQYAVYSSGKYDMAVMGWRLSAYPGYLCEWFGAVGQFENTGSRLGSACEALAVESDLARAQVKLFEVQSILMDELPFIPLYAQSTYDAFQNVSYPFDEAVGGLSGLYGAPSYAMPAK